MDIQENKIGPYRVLKTIKTGSVNKVYLVCESKGNKYYALKLSSFKDQLFREYKILKNLSKSQIFFRVYEYGMLENQDFMVLELLGRNFLYKSTEKPFSIECVSALGYQLLEQIELVHNNLIVHQNINPSKIFISKSKYQVFLTGFNKSKNLIKEHENTLFKSKNQITGNPDFASINNHLGITLSLRDDLEALMYVLLYLILGKLPWQDDFTRHQANSLEIWKGILTQKMNFEVKNGPKEFAIMLNYIKKLVFDEIPDYYYLKGLLKAVLRENDLIMNFDWLKLKKIRKPSKEKELAENESNLGIIQNEILSNANYQKPLPYTITNQKNQPTREKISQKARPEVMRKPRKSLTLNTIDIDNALKAASLQNKIFTKKKRVKKLKQKKEFSKFDIFEGNSINGLNNSDLQILIESQEGKKKSSEDSSIFELETSRKLPEFKNKKIILSRDKELSRSFCRII